MNTDWDWLGARARISADHAALEFGGKTLSYAELHSRVGASADTLRGFGVLPGDVVAALLPNGENFAVLLHAVAACGGVFLPLNLRLTPREIEPQLREAGVRLLVHGPDSAANTARSFADRLPGLRSVAAAELANTAASRSASGATEPRESGETNAGPDSPLAILFTSGTSGAPKGAELTRGSFVWSALASAFHLGMHRNDRWLACMPLFHVGGLSILLRTVFYGNTVIVHERFDPAAVNAALDRDGITCTSFVATMLARVLEERGDRPAPPQLRCVLLGGGPAPAGLIERAVACGFPIAPTYGLTEAASQVATRPPGDASDAAGGGLRPLLGCDVRVIGDGGRELPDGEAGVLCVRSPGVMRRYVNRPEATAAALRDGWLHTGDIGIRAKDGSLTIFDRRSDLILSGGENVYPSEIEAVLTEHPAVAEAAVAGVRDPEFGRRPVAWLVLRPGAAPDETELHGYCRDRLAAYKIPVAFHPVADLPRTPSGKLQRHRLG